MVRLEKVPGVKQPSLERIQWQPVFLKVMVLASGRFKMASVQQWQSPPATAFPGSLQVCDVDATHPFSLYICIVLSGDQGWCHLGGLWLQRTQDDSFICRTSGLQTLGESFPLNYDGNQERLCITCSPHTPREAERAEATL